MYGNSKLNIQIVNEWVWDLAENWRAADVVLLALLPSKFTLDTFQNQLFFSKKISGKYGLLQEGKR